MRQGTTLETIQMAQEMRLLKNLRGAQGPSAQDTDLTKLPPDSVQTLIKNSDGSYSVGSTS